MPSGVECCLAPARFASESRVEGQTCRTTTQKLESKCYENKSVHEHQGGERSPLRAEIETKRSVTQERRARSDAPYLARAVGRSGNVHSRCLRRQRTQTAVPASAPAEQRDTRTRLCRA